jgi:hypothetical protein
MRRTIVVALVLAIVGATAAGAVRGGGEEDGGQHLWGRPTAPADVIGGMYQRSHRRRAASTASRAAPVYSEAKSVGSSPRTSPYAHPAEKVVPAPKLPGPRRLVQLAFMHRHGARTSPVVSHGLLDWSRCHLSGEGANMARSLGRFLRGRYGANNSTDTAASYNFIPRDLNTSTYHVRTTDFERTVRTGFGVMRGLFPNATVTSNATNRAAFLDTVPYIMHEGNNADILIDYYYSWGGAMLRVPKFNEYGGAHDAATRLLLSETNLTALGRILGIPKMCAAEPTTCALFAEDVGMCRRSNDGISDEFRDLLPPLIDVLAQSITNLYSFNRSSRFDANKGAYALPLIRTIAGQFHAALAGARGEQKLVYHYSAHDTTVHGFLSGLGVIDDEALGPGVDTLAVVPRFTTLALLELYSDATVTLVYAHCDQEMKSAYNFTVDPLPQLKCTDAAGKTYRAKTCSLDDFNRFSNGPSFAAIGESAPKVDPCYADPADVALTQCDPRDAGPASPSTERLAALEAAAGAHAEVVKVKACLTYRRMCPQVACNVSLVYSETRGAPVDGTVDNLVLNRVRWACEPTAAPAAVPTARHMKGYVLSGFFGFVVGIVGGAAVAVCVVLRRLRLASKHDAAVQDLHYDSLPVIES